MSITQCREIAELNELVQVQLKTALDKIEEKGINPLVVETRRSLERQYYLAGQGRTVAQCVALGMPSKYAKKYAAPKKSQVTKTLNSIHISGFAVDVVPQRDVKGKMKAIWNAQDKETKTIIAIMSKYGFEAGANWSSFKDSPHFQVKGCRGVVYSSSNNNTYITKTIQKALNKHLGAGLITDGIWGKATTQAVNMFRKKCGWKETGSIGKTALKVLLLSL